MLSRTSATRKEIEVQLREWGCPYDVLDGRSIIWLEGYRAGCRQGLETGRDIASEVFAEVFGSAQ